MPDLPAAAWSLDGRHFAFEAPLDGLELRVGGYVSLGPEALGQVHDLALARRGVARGEGAIVDGGTGPFDGRAIAPAAADAVEAWLGRCAPRGAALPFGELVHAPGVPFTLDAGGFGRHTFLCGQSGSGETYALGGVLERLLAETGLRLVILDPNSDHVRLAHVREGVDPALAVRYEAAAAGVAVRRAHLHGPERLRLRFARLDAATQAALLRMTRSTTAPSTPPCSTRSRRPTGERCRWRIWTLDGAQARRSTTGRGTSASSAGASGPRATRAQGTTSCAHSTPACSSSTSAAWPRARNRRSSPRPPWPGCGPAGRNGGRRRS